MPPRHRPGGIPARALALAVLVITLAATTGCGTVRTLQSLDDGAPVLFSGTRLNAESLVNRPRAERRAGVAAPRLAALDLPFSTALDVVLLPVTGPVALLDGLNDLLRRFGRS